MRRRRLRPALCAPFRHRALLPPHDRPASRPRGGGDGQGDAQRRGKTKGLKLGSKSSQKRRRAAVAARAAFSFDDIEEQLEARGAKVTKAGNGVVGAKSQGTNKGREKVTLNEVERMNAVMNHAAFQVRRWALALYVCAGVGGRVHPGFFH